MARGATIRLKIFALCCGLLLLAEAVTDGNVTDQTYAAVSQHFDHAQFVELALVSAFYAMVARMLDAMRVQLEPEAREYSPKLP